MLSFLSSRPCFNPYIAHFRPDSPQLYVEMKVWNALSRCMKRLTISPPVLPHSSNHPQPPSSNHISFIPAQICIGKVSISTVFTPPPHHINHLSGHPFILPLFNKLAAALATAISHSILVGFSSTRRQFQRFLSLFLVVLPVWGAVRPFLCYIHFPVHVTGLVCLISPISHPPPLKSSWIIHVFIFHLSYTFVPGQ